MVHLIKVQLGGLKLLNFSSNARQSPQHLVLAKEVPRKRALFERLDQSEGPMMKKIVSRKIVYLVS